MLLFNQLEDSNINVLLTFWIKNFLGFGQSAEIHVLLDGEENRKWVELKQDANRRVKCPVYYDGETISGKVYAS